jgi:hypothetical protein
VHQVIRSVQLASATCQADVGPFPSDAAPGNRHTVPNHCADSPWAGRCRKDLLELLDRVNPTLAVLTAAVEQEAKKRLRGAAADALGFAECENTAKQNNSRSTYSLKWHLMNSFRPSRPGRK